MNEFSPEEIIHLIGTILLIIGPIAVLAGLIGMVYQETIGIVGYEITYYPYRIAGAGAFFGGIVAFIVGWVMKNWEVATH